MERIQVEAPPLPPVCTTPTPMGRAQGNTPSTRMSRISRISVAVSLLPLRQRLPARLRRLLAAWLQSWTFKVILNGCLIFALFGGGFWVLFDFPDEPGNSVLDALMCTVSVIFLAELVLNCLVEYRVYPGSFFFFADLLGTISMIFEISFLLGPAGKMLNATANVSSALLRTARAAKVGARVGRLSKLVKCLSMVYKGKDDKRHNGATAEAKVLSEHLMLALSTKVSLLTIGLVLIVPLFQIGSYPEEDLSMRSWAFRLEEEYRAAYDDLVASPPGQSNASAMFSGIVNRFVGFYSGVGYQPFKVEGYDGPVAVGNRLLSIAGASAVQGVEPRRKQSIFRQEVPNCLLVRSQCDGAQRAALYFDFKAQRQFEAGIDMVMIIFVILVMISAYFDLSRTLDRMIVKPLERMLGTVRSMASNLLRQFGIDEQNNTDAEADSDVDQAEFAGKASALADETMLLESIFRKFARLAAIGTQSNLATAEELASMDAEGMGVMQMMNLDAGAKSGKSGTDSPAKGSAASKEVGAWAALAAGRSQLAVPELPVSAEVLESWDLDVLALDADRLGKVCLYVLFDSKVGQATGHVWVRVDKFVRFLSVVRAGYNDLPYHCYAHACDVLHTVFRVLTVTDSEQWLSSIERYALLVAALCHDIGHQGRTNPFLVETKHELALRYNDRSPLENMHCARLFSICGREETDVFDQATSEEQKQARKVCISAILHTDNALHFDIVREISKVYELASDICESQAMLKSDFTQPYLEQVLQKNSSLWIQLLLHFADVSNPLKPFAICKLWAWRVLDEFFAQGDEEKALGIPVGMLNDRDRINRPGSQHGFICFLVAPLVFATVKLFPPLHPLSTQMAANLEAWRDLWVEDAKPSREDTAKKDVDVQKIWDTAKQLRNRQ